VIKHTVQIKPTSLGRRLIIVDGEWWGVILMRPHGPNGAEYTFHQRVRNAPPLASVQGTTAADRGQAGTLEARLYAAAVELVRTGRLVPLSVIRKRRQDERTRFEEKAREALASGTRDAIVKAMRWAQQVERGKRRRT
jgi:hypothetical protein